VNMQWFSLATHGIISQ